MAKNEKTLCIEDLLAGKLPVDGAVVLNIKNLHIHMDEHMTTNYYDGGMEEEAEEPAYSDEDTCEADDAENAENAEDDLDFDEMLENICKATGLCEKKVLLVLKAQADYWDSIYDKEGTV